MNEEICKNPQQPPQQEPPQEQNVKLQAKNQEPEIKQPPVDSIR